MKQLAILAVVFLLVSCAANTAQDPIDYRSRDYRGDDQQRIIYRDLTIPKTSSRSPSPTATRDLELARLTQQLQEGRARQVSSAKPALTAAAPAAIVSIPTTTAPLYIPFLNESSQLPTEHLSVLREMIEQHQAGDRYVVVGHSHGQSLVGTATLAQQRAEAVTDWMIAQGINKHVIHQTASWSSHRDMFGPPKGVLVYVTGEHNGQFFLALTPFNMQQEGNHEPQWAQTDI